MSKALADLLAGPFDQRFAFLRLLVAALAGLALLAERALELRGAPARLTTKKSVAGVLAVMSVVTYFQCFDYGYRYLLHRSEHFHYHVGAKYFPELGYERLYTCTAVAEAELGGEAKVRARTLRDLHRNVLVPAASALDDAAVCHAAFGSTVAAPSSQWRSFREDVRRFRALVDDDYWRTIQNDHGFNGTPAWALLGGGIARAGVVTLDFLRFLASLDVALMSLAGGLVAWALGWRVACLTIVFWGTQAASTMHWTGGAFLRQDAIVCLVGAACFLRKGRPFVAGSLLGWAAVTRLYPIFLLAVMAVSAVAAWRRARALPPTWKRLAAGVLATSLVLVPASVAYGGAGAYRGFVEHIRMHDATPTTNRMGWHAVVGHHAAGRAMLVEQPRAVDPFGRWKALRRERLAQLRPVYAGGMVAAALLLAWVAFRLRSAWLSLCTGVLSLTVHVGLTCYYHAFLILLAPLSRARRHVEIALIGTAIAGNAVVLRFPWYDDRYAVLSLLHVVLTTFVALLFARSRTEGSS